MKRFRQFIAALGSTKRIALLRLMKSEAKHFTIHVELGKKSEAVIRELTEIRSQKFLWNIKGNK